jgi:hypothetical protein
VGALEDMSHIVVRVADLTVRTQAVVSETVSRRSGSRPPRHVTHFVCDDRLNPPFPLRTPLSNGIGPRSRFPEPLKSRPLIVSLTGLRSLFRFCVMPVYCRVIIPTYRDDVRVQVVGCRKKSPAVQPRANPGRRKVVARARTPSAGQLSRPAKQPTVQDRS